MTIQTDTIALAHATGEANAAYAALLPTQTECPCCRQPHYPTGTPEWAAWSAAHDRQMTIAAECLLDGVATIVFLVMQLGVTAESIEYYRARVYRERKSERDRLARMGETEGQGHTGDRAEG